MAKDQKVTEYIERSRQWPAPMAALRPILLSCGLTEEIKWGKPCYSYKGANIVIMQEMKTFLALMFFKGALLADPAGVLVDQGPNSRSARRIQFASPDEVNDLSQIVVAYVDEAIQIEAEGIQVAPAPELKLVQELQGRLETDPALRRAFESLTPGRQREYNIYFSGAKQSKTRAARVEKYIPRILAGRGFRDR